MPIMAATMRAIPAAGRANQPQPIDSIRSDSERQSR
jgi:hypothetical protein